MKRSRPGNKAAPRRGRTYSVQVEAGSRIPCTINFRHDVTRPPSQLFLRSTDETRVVVSSGPLEYHGKPREETEISLEAIGVEAGQHEVSVWLTDKPFGEVANLCESITLKVNTLPGLPQAPQPHVDVEDSALVASTPAKSPLKHDSVPPTPPSADVSPPPLVRSQSKPSLRRMNSSAHLAKSGYKFDLCVVFPAKNGKLKREGQAIFDAIEKAGYETQLGLTEDGGRMLCLLHLSLHLLRQFADEQDYTLPLDKDRLRSRVETGWPPPYGLAPEAPAAMIAPCLLGTRDDFRPMSQERREPERIFRGPKVFTYLVDYVKADVWDKNVYLWDPFRFIYGKYDTNERIQELFQHAGPGIDHPFNDVARMNIMLEHLTNLRVHGVATGPPLSVQQCVEAGYIVKDNGIFPLHNISTLTKLREQAIQNRRYPFQGDWLPLPHRLHAHDHEDECMEQFRLYFGEKIALYFNFVGHLTSWLTALSVISFIFSMEQVGTNDYNSPGVAAFSVLVSIWALLMLECWQRTEQRLACKWGTTDFESKETERAEFHGEEIWSYYGEGKHIVHYPPEQARRRKNWSQVNIIMLVLLVLLLVLSCYTARKILVQSDFGGIGEQYGPSIASGLNLAQITVMEMLFTKIARKLNDQENYRTDTAYEDALISKMFKFNFINSYAGLYYLAFLQEHYDADVELLACHGHECVSKLSMALFVVMVGKIASGNGKQLVKPIVQRMAKKLVAKMKGRAAAEESAAAEQPQERLHAMECAKQEAEMPTYDQMHDSLQDFNQLAQYFGYAILFVVAAPWATIIACIGHSIEIRLDSHKLLHFNRRPLPRKAQDIGTWLTIFKLFVLASIVTNSATLAFTLDVAAELSSAGRVWFFLFLQYVSFGIVQGLAVAIPDVPEEVRIHHERQEQLVSKYLDVVPDEEELVRQKLDGLLFVSYDEDRKRPDVLPGHLDALRQRGVTSPPDLYVLPEDERQRLLGEVGFTDEEIENIETHVEQVVAHKLLGFGLAELLPEEHLPDATAQTEEKEEERKSRRGSKNFLASFRRRGRNFKTAEEEG